MSPEPNPSDRAKGYLFESNGRIELQLLIFLLIAAVHRLSGGASVYSMPVSILNSYAARN